MGLWHDPDVTPAGQPPGAGAGAAPPYSGYDPFGARPTRRKRGWVRVAIGIVLILGGFAAIAAGIVFAVGERDRIETEAVARGATGEPLAFTADEPGDYTVFLIGAFGDSTRTERVVARTACVVAFSVGARQFSGSRQGFSITLGSAASIGHFDAPAGDVELQCQGPGFGEIVVTPGRPGIGLALGGIFGGAVSILAGIGLLIWGLIGRRVSV